MEIRFGYCRSESESLRLVMQPRPHSPLTPSETVRIILYTDTSSGNWRRPEARQRDSNSRARTVHRHDDGRTVTLTRTAARGVSGRSSARGGPGPFGKNAANIGGNGCREYCTAPRSRQVSGNGKIALQLEASTCFDRAASYADVSGGCYVDQTISR